MTSVTKTKFKSAKYKTEVGEREGKTTFLPFSVYKYGEMLND